MPDFKLLSADGHLSEPPAAWERARKEFGDRAPRLVTNPPDLRKGIWMFVDGLPPVYCSHYQMGEVVEKGGGISDVDPAQQAKTVAFIESFRYEDYPQGWEPAARLAQQDSDGIEAEVIYPSPALTIWGLTDEPLQRSILRSYNAWLHDFCSHDPQRLIGIPLLSILDVEHAVADLEEYAKLGFRGVALPPGIKDGGYYDPMYEPLWAAADDAGIVISFHSGPAQGVPRTSFPGPRKYDPLKHSMGFAGVQDKPQQLLGNLIFSGIFDRHPKLQVAIVEFDVGWVAHLVQRFDYHWGRQRAWDPHLDVNKRKPTEYLRSNISFTFQDDRAGMLTTPIYGEDNYMWASDYPHGGSTFPYSPQTVDRNFEGIDPAVKRKIARDNLSRLYGLGL